MEDKQPPKNESLKRAKQQITIPFIWEERPGTPKRDWRPDPKLWPPAPAPPPPPPVKFSASVPFKWEEKPGTPLRCFVENSKKSAPPPPQPPPETLCFSLPPPPAAAYYHKYGSSGSDLGSSSDNDYDDEGWISDLGFGTLSAHSEAISSPESSTSASTYPTVSTSLKGASFLEHLFPLYPPKSGYLDQDKRSYKTVHHPEDIHVTPKQQIKKNFIDKHNYDGAIRRPLTLGELIMLSRRRSYQRKAVKTRKQNSRKEYKERPPQGCCVFGMDNDWITKFLRKDLHSLKVA